MQDRAGAPRRFFTKNLRQSLEKRWNRKTRPNTAPIATSPSKRQSARLSIKTRLQATASPPDRFWWSFNNTICQTGKNRRKPFLCSRAPSRHRRGGKRWGKNTVCIAKFFGGRPAGFGKSSETARATQIRSTSRTVRHARSSSRTIRLAPTSS